MRPLPPFHPALVFSPPGFSPHRSYNLCAHVGTTKVCPPYRSAAQVAPLFPCATSPACGLLARDPSPCAQPLSLVPSRTATRGVARGGLRKGGGYAEMVRAGTPFVPLCLRKGGWTGGYVQTWQGRGRGGVRKRGRRKGQVNKK